MKINFLNNIRFNIQRVNRLLQMNRISDIVWNDLIKMIKKTGLPYKQYDTEKYIETNVSSEKECLMKFRYEIINKKLLIKAIFLSGFDAGKTYDIMILSSHLNSLLNFGVVRVNTNGNYVQYDYSGDLLLYYLYSGEIHSDITRHFDITEECLWAFNYMLNTGNDPVFVIAELLKRNEQKNTEKK